MEADERELQKQISSQQLFEAELEKRLADLQTQVQVRERERDDLSVEVDRLAQERDNLALEQQGLAKENSALRFSFVRGKIVARVRGVIVSIKAYSFQDEAYSEVGSSAHIVDVWDDYVRYVDGVVKMMPAADKSLALAVQKKFMKDCVEIGRKRISIPAMKRRLAPYELQSYWSRSDKERQYLDAAFEKVTEEFRAQVDKIVKNILSGQEEIEMCLESL